MSGKSSVCNRIHDLGAGKFGCDPPHHGLRKSQGVFPDSQYPPASSLEFVVCIAIPSPVPSDLKLPIFAVPLRHAQMPWTAVPEATVNEDGETLAAEHKVRLSRKSLMAAPAGDSVAPENGDQFEFSGPVSG